MNIKTAAEELEKIAQFMEEPILIMNEIANKIIKTADSIQDYEKAKGYFNNLDPDNHEIAYFVIFILREIADLKAYIDTYEDIKDKALISARDGFYPVKSSVWSKYNDELKKIVRGLIKYTTAKESLFKLPNHDWKKKLSIMESSLHNKISNSKLKTSFDDKKLQSYFVRAKRLLPKLKDVVGYVKKNADIIKNGSMETDREFRSEAMKFWKKLYDFLTKKDIRRLREVPARGGWALDARIIDQKYKNLIFIIGYGGKYGGGFGKKGKYSIISFSPLSAPFDTKFFKQGLERNRNIFVHEFIHYLDSLRRKSGEGDSSVKLEESLESYYNDPDEFNAYYQDGVSKIDEVFFEDGRMSKSKMKFWENSFPKWINKWGKFFFDNDFINHLNPKYTKKLKKRLYSVHQEIKKDIHSGEIS